MKYLLQALFLFFVISCSYSQKENKEINNRTVSDLLGLWINSNFDDFMKGRMSLRDFFRPCTGFALYKDSSTKKYRITIQYGEQIGGDFFDSIKIKNGLNKDTILGFKSNKSEFIGFLHRDLSISDFALIDYNVYYHNKDSLLKYSYAKLSTCVSNNFFKNYIMSELFRIFPLKVTFENKTYNLKNLSNECGGAIQIGGFLEYTDLQFINYNYDSLHNVKNFEISMYNQKTKNNEFFVLSIDRIQKADLIRSSSLPAMTP